MAKKEFSFAELDKSLSKIDGFEMGSILETNEFSKTTEWISTGNYLLNAQLSGSLFGGIANRKRWIKFWIDNPIEASNRWWKTECNLLKKQATVQQIAQRQANKHVPFTLDRKHDSRNKSGYAGVSWFPKYGKWRAQIGMMPITIGLGYFESQEQAHQIFLKAKAIRLMWRQGCINRECAITQIKALQKGKVS